MEQLTEMLQLIQQLSTDETKELAKTTLNELTEDDARDVVIEWAQSTGDIEETIAQLEEAC